MPDLPASTRPGTGHGGLACVRVETAHATAEVYLQGAHVTAWQPRGQEPVLWTSGSSRFEVGAPIRGGVPICFPWFGAHPDDPSAPAHGWARIVDWELLGAHEDPASGDVTLELGLTDTDATRASAWPHAFAATYRVRVGRALHLELEVTNRDEEPVTLTQALHTYLAVADVREVNVHGLAGAPYVDKVGPDAPASARQGDEPLRFTGETDRVHTSEATVRVVDPGLARTLTVAKQGSGSTVVWNPWVAKARAMPDFGDDEWPTMVCVEAANVGDAAVTVAPGASHVLATTVTATAGAPDQA